MTLAKEDDLSTLRKLLKSELIKTLTNNKITSNLDIEFLTINILLPIKLIKIHLMFNNLVFDIIIPINQIS